VSRARIAGRRAGNREYSLYLVRGAPSTLEEADIEGVVGGG
jgi:hypothetical protein